MVKRRQAFTLIELIITLSIISIVLSLVLPNKNMFSYYGQNNEVKALERDLLTARARSVAEGKIYSFEMVDNLRAYTIVRDNLVIKRVDLNHIRFSNFFTFYFIVNGSASKSGTIEIRAGNNETYEIKVAVATGKITLYGK